MFIRFLAFFAIFHGALYGAGNALEHLVHLTAPQEVSGEGHHHHHEGSLASSADEDWVNCVFCLDGIVSTGIKIVTLLDVLPVHDFSSTVLHSFKPNGTLQGFHARAPPGYFLSC